MRILKIFRAFYISRRFGNNLKRRALWGLSSFLFQFYEESVVESFFDMRIVPAISQDFHKSHIADVSSIMRVLHWASCVCYHRHVAHMLRHKVQDIVLHILDGKADIYGTSKAQTRSATFSLKRGNAKAIHKASGTGNTRLAIEMLRNMIIVGELETRKPGKENYIAHLFFQRGVDFVHKLTKDHRKGIAGIAQE